MASLVFSAFNGGTAIVVSSVSAAKTAVANSPRFIIRFARGIKSGSARALAFVLGLITSVFGLAIIIPILYRFLEPIISTSCRLGQRFGQRVERMTNKTPIVGVFVSVLSLSARALNEYVFKFVLFVIDNIVAIVFLTLAIIIFTAVQYNLAKYVEISSSFTYAGIQTYNYGGRIVNFTLDGGNSYVLPIYNGVTRNQMLVIQHTYEGIQNNRPQSDFGDDVVGGRRARALQGPPQTADELVVREYAWMNEIYNEYILTVIDFVFDVLYPPFAYIMSILTFIAGRASCMIAGGGCTSAEIGQAIANVFIDGINAFFGFLGKIERIDDLACSIEQLKGVNCDTCKGVFFSSSTGMFEALLECTERRGLIECVENKDGSFIEKIDGLKVHEALTEAKSCPHSKDMFSGFGNARNNFRMNVREYSVNYHGIPFRSLYHQGEHIITTGANMDSKHVRRRMKNIDTARVVNWTRPEPRRDTRSTQRLNRQAKADLLRAKYLEKRGNCQFGNSWTDIFSTTVDLACLFDTLTGNDIISHIESRLPEKQAPLIFDQISHRANRMLLASEAISAHPSRSLATIMEDLTPGHKVTPYYGMYRHMVHHRNKTKHQKQERSRRRELSIIDICAPLLTCANGEQCVDDLKKCGEPTEWSVSTFLIYTGQQAGNSMKDESLDDSIVNVRDCIDTWQKYPSTDPYQYDVLIEGRTEGLIYCSPMIEYTDWRPAAITYDLQTDVNTLCRSTTVFNGCNCSSIFYDPPKAAVQAGNYISLDLEYSLINSLLWFRQLLSMLGLTYNAFGQGVATLLAGTSAPLWMQYFFLGTNGGLTDYEALFCWVLHTGDFCLLILFLMVVFYYILATIRLYLYTPYSQYLRTRDFNQFKDHLEFYLAHKGKLD